MNKYMISCPITGYLDKIPHEDGELNDAMLRAFDSADCGDLHDVDMTEELWQVKGYYTFTVSADSEEEALAKAQNEFDKLWDGGEVMCGDLHDIERVKYTNGDEYRCNGKVEAEQLLDDIEQFARAWIYELTNDMHSVKTAYNHKNENWTKSVEYAVKLRAWEESYRKVSQLCHKLDGSVLALFEKHFPEGVESYKTERK